MFDLGGKTALVTGASTGIGAAIAVSLASRGADVAISCRHCLNLEETHDKAKAFGHRVFTFEMDVSDMEQIEKGVEAVKNEFGRVDILINNAGLNRPKSGLEATEEEWDEIFDTNVKGGFFLAQKLAPGMIEHKWGRVIWISSQSGVVGIAGQPLYCSSKAAVIHMARTLGLEWAKYGITVNTIAPTFVYTNLTRKRLEDEKFRSYVLGMIPAGKYATADDVAAAAVYLASEEAGMVNCHTLCVDGGWTAW